VQNWKPASLFSHARTKYPLTGAHGKTACAKCHVSLADVKPYVKYTGLAFTKCSACHADPHKGSFPASCESCHNTSNWRQIAQLQGFDHSKTKYPLLGKHATVGCTDCHTHGDFKTPVPFAKCRRSWSGKRSIASSSKVIIAETRAPEPRGRELCPTDGDDALRLHLRAGSRTLPPSA